MSLENKKNKLFYKLFKYATLAPLLLFLPIANNPNSLKAGIEFQWDSNQNFKKLKWFQTEEKKNFRNKIYLFLRSSDRKTGLLKISLKFPDRFTSQIKKEKISLCEVRLGGFNSKTKCLKTIPTEIEIDKENNNVDIFPVSPIPSDKKNIAIHLKVSNPKRGGLYQFHGFGQSSGKVPVSYYLGSWTLITDSQ